MIFVYVIFVTAKLWTGGEIRTNTCEKDNDRSAVF